MIGLVVAGMAKIECPILIYFDEYFLHTFQEVIRIPCPIAVHFDAIETKSTVVSLFSENYFPKGRKRTISAKVELFRPVEMAHQHLQIRHLHTK